MVYPSYSYKFAATARPQSVQYLQSYSYMNTFRGAVMAYAVTGDPKYLAILHNAHD